MFSITKKTKDHKLNCIGNYNTELALSPNTVTVPKQMESYTINRYIFGISEGLSVLCVGRRQQISICFVAWNTHTPAHSTS